KSHTGNGTRTLPSCRASPTAAIATPTSPAGKRYVTTDKVKTHRPSRVSDHWNRGKPNQETRAAGLSREGDEGSCVLGDGADASVSLPDPMVCLSHVQAHRRLKMALHRTAKLAASRMTSLISTLRACC